MFASVYTSLEPASTLRGLNRHITLNYPKLLKYTWEMRYWINRDYALAFEFGGGRLCGMNAAAIHEMLDQHVASVTDQQVKMDQVRVMYSCFEQSPIMQKFFTESSDGTAEGVERLMKHTKQQFLTQSGQTLQTTPVKRPQATDASWTPARGPTPKSSQTAWGARGPAISRSRGRGGPGRLTREASRGRAAGRRFDRFDRQEAPPQ